MKHLKYKKTIFTAVMFLTVTLILSNDYITGNGQFVNFLSTQKFSKKAQKKACLELIKATWDAKQTKDIDDKVPLEKLFRAIFANTISNDMNNKVKNRGSMTLKKQTHYNFAAKKSFGVVLNKINYTIDLPKTLKGTFKSTENECSYYFSKGYRACISKKVWGISVWTYLESIRVTQTKLYVNFTSKKNNIVMDY